MIFFIYQTLILFIVILSPLIIIYRILKNKEHKKRFIEKFTIFSEKRDRGNIVWFHASSVGEVLSIVPLIEKLENNKSIKKILITSSTLSSSYIFSKIRFKKTIHQFFPIDLNVFTNRFVEYWKPSMAIFVESEIWPSIFLQLKKKSIPLILLNARITKKSFRKWSKIKIFSNQIFSYIKTAYPQNSETSKYLKKLGVKKVRSIGNLKFTESKLDKKNFFKNNYDKSFKNRTIWCAASTHPDEEIICAKAHLLLKKNIKNLLTIIIPRHIHRTQEILDQLNNYKLDIVCQSSNQKLKKNTDIFLVDSYGETKKFYSLSNTVFLGGSLIKHGGQNPLEPARLGKSIIHGPNIDNFKEVYNLLDTRKISFKVKNISELASSVKKLINPSKNDKIKYVKIREIGNSILNKTVYEINTLIKNETKKT